MKTLTLHCPKCDHAIALELDSVAQTIACPVCDWAQPLADSTLTLGDYGNDPTADHYSHQWGEQVDYFGFLMNSATRLAKTVSVQLGWNDLFDTIVARAQNETVRVYDAACGFGAIPAYLLAKNAPGLVYVGADIHDSLARIAKNIPALEKHGLLFRWDISRPLPVDPLFDVVICRAALHHTPDPARTLAGLVAMTRPGGTVAISVYNKKAPAREALDDAFRKQIVPMPVDQAMDAARQFARFGKALQAVTQKIAIEEDLPVLGIAAGEYGLQQLIYDHFLKCFYNDDWGEAYSAIVNFDWYHPAYAYRYSEREARDLLQTAGLEIEQVKSMTAQHFLIARKPA